MKINLDNIFNNSFQWSEKSSKAQRELVIKKIFLAVITAANFVAIAALLTAITSFTTVPTTALIISPFVAGVIAALARLKYSTMGVTSVNYSSYTNPAFLLSTVITLVFFTPVLICSKIIDWNNYGDPYVANKISNELETGEFEKVILTYGPNISNLKRYGFIFEIESEKFKQIYHDVKPLIEAKNFLIKEEVDQDLRKIQKKIDRLKNEWLGYVGSLHLPHPHAPAPDFNKKTTQFKIWIRNNFGITSKALN